jgi:hypothetical protein
LGLLTLIGVILVLAMRKPKVAVPVAARR